MVRSSVAREVGGFSENLTRYNDADFICRVTQLCQVAVFPEVAVISHFAHEYEQMGHETPQNLAAAADFIRAHTLRFQDELRDRSRARATLLRRLAGLEMALGNRRAALAALAAAFRLDPIDVIRAILKNRALAARIISNIPKKPSVSTKGTP